MREWVKSVSQPQSTCPNHGTSFPGFGFTDTQKQSDSINLPNRTPTLSISCLELFGRIGQPDLRALFTLSHDCYTPLLQFPGGTNRGSCSRGWSTSSWLPLSFNPVQRMSSCIMTALLWHSQQWQCYFGVFLWGWALGEPSVDTDIAC